MFLKKKVYSVVDFFIDYSFCIYSNLLVVTYFSSISFFFVSFPKVILNNALLSLYKINFFVNLVLNVNQYFYYEFILDGLYYRVKYYKKYNCLGFILGYNHYILYFVPRTIKILCHLIRRRFVLYGFDKGLLGKMAAEIVNLKYPNLFKGRGVKLINFSYRRKILVKKK